MEDMSDIVDVNEFGEKLADVQDETEDALDEWLEGLNKGELEEAREKLADYAQSEWRQNQLNELYEMKEELEEAGTGDDKVLSIWR